MTLIYMLSIEKGVNRQRFAMSTSRVPVQTYQLQCYDKLAKFIVTVDLSVMVIHYKQTNENVSYTIVFFLESVVALKRTGFCVCVYT